MPQTFLIHSHELSLYLALPLVGIIMYTLKVGEVRQNHKVTGERSCSSDRAKIGTWTV